MKQVIFDTNCLLYAIEKRIDPFEAVQRMFDEPIEVLVPEGVVNELKAMAGKKTKEALFASAALKLIKAKGIEAAPSEGPVDKWITDYAAKRNAVVCTYDRQLRKNLKKLGVKGITLKRR